MPFELSAEDKKSKARAGKFRTDHGTIETPVFMPVGTAGTVKAVHQKDLAEDVQAQIILGNTYHLNLRPGIPVLENAGGLHKFMSWNKPLLTDSGGYQVFSMTEMRKIKEEGVTFRSHIDGSSHFISPEISIDIQRSIGADIIMAFDECTPYPCEYSFAKKSMHLTHRWLMRSCEHFDEQSPRYAHQQTIFPIVQGSTYKDLRKESAEFISGLNRDGNAIGGLSVGEPEEIMYEITQQVCEILPSNKPRYLMGVGTPVNILECIALGIDMFDCVIPTRNARNGMLYTQNGIINIRNEKWKDDFSPIDPEGTSFVDALYSKAYLRHLMISKEILASQIATLHNLCFYMWLVKEARNKILEGTFDEWKNKTVKQLRQRL
jgi:queuine tRNA-ribosyltransferase